MREFHDRVLKKPSTIPYQPSSHPYQSTPPFWNPSSHEQFALARTIDKTVTLQPDTSSFQGPQQTCRSLDCPLARSAGLCQAITERRSCSSRPRFEDNATKARGGEETGLSLVVALSEEGPDAPSPPRWARTTSLSAAFMLLKWGAPSLRSLGLAATCSVPYFTHHFLNDAIPGH
jgi:hypothetical protein